MRRRLLLTLPWLAGACSVIPARPYVEKRDWPLSVRRSTELSPHRGGRVLLIRTMTAAPGLEQRGLHALQQDGSMKIDYYEEWLVPPAQGVEDSLRRWLAASGKFAAVLSPGSRLMADFALESELTALWTDTGARQAKAGISFVLLDQRKETAAVLVQQSVTGTAPIDGADAAALVDAQLRALAEALDRIEFVLSTVK